jgi:hypothetical protein
MARDQLLEARIDQQRDLITRLNEENADLRKIRDALEQELAAAREEDEEDRLANLLSFKPLTIEVPHDVAGAPGHPMTMWSDWHWGETVDPREMGGLNAFNEEIAQQRVRNLVSRTINILRNYAGMRAEYPDGMTVFLGGDMVSGLIHEELVATNWGNIVDQAQGVASAIAGGLITLADAFGKVNVVGVVGNHGRLTKKPQAKGRALDSYDRSVYKAVKHQLGLLGEWRVSIEIPDEIDRLVHVYNHRFMLTHGDALGASGGDGFIGAIGPIMRGSLKIAIAQSQINRDFDTIVIGHWHQYMPRGDANPVIVNGTLKGYDEYARNILRARFARPSQALWLVSPKNGVAAQWPVYVD